jgi:hypothetical protein
MNPKVSVGHSNFFNDQCWTIALKVAILRPIMVQNFWTRTRIRRVGQSLGGFLITFLITF